MLGRTDLRKAARAGALVKVVRKADYAWTGLEAMIASDRFMYTRSIHGSFTLPDEYAFVPVPHDTRFVAERPPDRDFPLGPKPTTISAAYSPVKILVAIILLLLSILTLYRSRGNQIGHFGYAAFGLTVTQYALMSFINLLANLSCPQYPNLYMAETELMRRVKYAFPSEPRFAGVVGVVDEDDSVPLDERDSKEAQDWTPGRIFRRGVWILAVLLPTTVSAVKIWGFTGFEPGTKSTLGVQRAAAMTWLALGGVDDRRGEALQLRTGEGQRKRWMADKGRQIGNMLLEIAILGGCGGLVSGARPSLCRCCGTMVLVRISSPELLRFQGQPKPRGSTNKWSVIRPYFPSSPKISHLRP